MSNKESLISRTYHAFYGSINDTLRDVQKHDPSIKYQDVKEWFNKNFVRRTNLKGYNSFVANYPFQEYQMDLFLVNDFNEAEVRTFIPCFSKDLRANLEISSSSTGKIFSAISTMVTSVPILR